MICFDGKFIDSQFFLAGVPKRFGVCARTNSANYNPIGQQPAALSVVAYINYRDEISLCRQNTEKNIVILQRISTLGY